MEKIIWSAVATLRRGVALGVGMLKKDSSYLLEVFFPS